MNNNLENDNQNLEILRSVDEYNIYIDNDDIHIIIDNYNIEFHNSNCNIHYNLRNSNVFNIIIMIREYNELLKIKTI